MDGFIFFWIAIAIFVLILFYFILKNRKLSEERDDNAINFVQTAFKFKKLKSYLQKRNVNVEKILNE